MQESTWLTPFFIAGEVARIRQMCGGVGSPHTESQVKQLCAKISKPADYPNLIYASVIAHLNKSVNDWDKVMFRLFERKFLPDWPLGSKTIRGGWRWHFGETDDGFGETWERIEHVGVLKTGEWLILKPVLKAYNSADLSRKRSEAGKRGADVTNAQKSGKT